MCSPESSSRRQSSLWRCACWSAGQRVQCAFLSCVNGVHHSIHVCIFIYQYSCAEKQLHRSTSQGLQAGRRWQCLYKAPLPLKVPYHKVFSSALHCAWNPATVCVRECGLLVHSEWHGHKPIHCAAIGCGGRRLPRMEENVPDDHQAVAVGLDWVPRSAWLEILSKQNRWR